MSKKKTPVIGIQEVGKFYIVDFADGLRIITTQEVEERVAKLRAAKRKKKR
jgi:hypothetical protein